VIVHQLNRVSAGAAVSNGEADGVGGSDGAVITAERVTSEVVPFRTVQLKALAPQLAPQSLQLELSSQAGTDGDQVIRVTGELDIATAEKAYSYISEALDGGQAPVSVDLSGLTFCDASGLRALARLARHARQAGRQLRLTAVRPSLLKLMRITGLDGIFPELGSPLGSPLAAYSVLPHRGSVR
jgi:anti-sigma B factor antagonist